MFLFEFCSGNNFLHNCVLSDNCILKCRLGHCKLLFEHTQLLTSISWYVSLLFQYKNENEKNLFPKGNALVSFSFILYALCNACKVNFLKYNLLRLSDFQL